MGGLSAAAVMSEVLPALLRPCSSSFSFSSSSFSSASASSSAASMVGRLLGRSSRYPYVFSRSISSSASPAAAAAAAVGDSSAALRGRGGARIPPCEQTLHQARSIFRAFATMSSELSESAANNPGLQEIPDEATKGYFLQQTMYRIKDPKVSLDFYTRILGMSLLKKLDFPEAKFSLYFIGFEDITSAPTDPSDRVAWTFGKKATLELTHNWGTESDENFKGHHNGNSDPRGYGHIGITVDDTYKACERFEKLGVKFVKKPDDGKMKGLAFIQDPDGYWIEIFDVAGMRPITAKS